VTGTTVPALPPTESKRVRQFRQDLVRELPKFPNNRATRDALLTMSLGQLLIHFGNWRLRLIRKAVRTVTVDAAVTGDPRYAQLQPGIDALLAKVHNGEDLTPHLSLGAVRQGYTPAALAPNPPPPAQPVDRWADKDFLLNVMGYHHLHLGTVIEPEGHIRRSNEVLFARLTRTTFEALLILDHSVFEKDPQGGMTPERTRLWTMFDQQSAQGVPPGTPYIPAMVTLSGHPMHLTLYSGRLVSTIRDLDQKLDDPAYVKELYDSAGIAVPKKPKLSFMLNGLDLGLFDAAIGQFWRFVDGPI